ncbi:MAG: haloacid dehalogenase [Bacteroidetes bacterium MedPE-SWsnd-G2]|nr:MAG: haloacid dehalogenase [Bacteroidetes bacterium MedPE-SWsnd-G2]
MIKTLIFDFGDVFINLDKQGALDNALNLFNLKTFTPDLNATNIAYETGQISTQEFVSFYADKFKNLNEDEIINAWNYILKDFPEHRLEFLKSLKENGKYQLILLSNTNELHIDWIKEHISFYDEFKACFDIFYLSHEIELRKPNTDIFQFVLTENNLKAQECLFIDDLPENTETAQIMGFNIWNIKPESEDVTTLFKTNNHLF